MADLGTTTYTAVSWAAGDVLTEAKLDSMVANDQGYDSHAAQGLLLNNNKAYCGKKAAGTNHNLLKLNASDILELSEAGIPIKPMITDAAEGDLFYLNSSLVLTRLAKGTAGQFLKMNSGATAPEYTSNTLSSKLIYSTRANDAISGDVSYTGVGFTPTKISSKFNIQGNVNNGTGFSDSSRTSGCLYTQYTGGLTDSLGFLVCLYTGSGADQEGVVKSYDADGFTLTWTRNASPPSGTIRMYFLCEK